MNWSLVFHALEQGLVFGIMALGVYITFQILDFPDLSVDGTFPLGAAITAKIIFSGGHPVTAILLAVIGGILAGGLTAFFHTRLKFTNLLSGILTMTLLYSVNLRIMGKSNIPLLGKITLIDSFNNLFPSFSIDQLTPFLFLLIILIVKFILDYFLSTEIGMAIRATGDNEQMIRSLGVDTKLTKIIGLCISNGLVALSGSLFAQYSGFADVGMGIGTIVAGLASVIIGHSIIRNGSIGWMTISVIIGSIIYRTTVMIALRYGYKFGFQPGDLKLISVLLVVIALTLPIFRGRIKAIATSNGSNGGDNK
ncbi:MAG: ABC transporter permease [Candidatus Caldatribacteriota bacterium]|jgi:putative ABC transport system permease protein|nr:ABC transporter permease [Atribacterota bacterium]MDD3641113.1 ABC transporter permease [Atribacterota bacterium]MDD4289342.1 ABC transporter permease [Atribacterota bacterium]MDD4764407.1 ABC transporter permease [Atribacterota bacterium]MDD5635232.1 ABC transporter permease [Atribacterota bacterium]